MARREGGAVVGLMGMLRRAMCRGVLDQPLGRASDREIDAALERAGSDRVKLFSPSGAIAPHRVRMAHMLAAHGVNAAYAVAQRWDALKIADHYCAHCSNARRCRNWLTWGRRNSAPSMFCPNAQLFESIAANQAGTGTLHRGPRHAEKCVRAR